MFRKTPQPRLALTDNPELSTAYRAVYNWFGEADPLTQKLGKFLIAEIWDSGRHEDYRNHVILVREQAEKATEALRHMYGGYPFHEPAISGLGKVLAWNMGDRIQAAALLGMVPPIELPGLNAQPLPYLGAVPPGELSIPKQRDPLTTDTAALYYPGNETDAA